MEQLLLQEIDPNNRRSINWVFGCAIGLLGVALPYSAYRVYQILLNMEKVEKQREALKDPSIVIRTES